MRVCESTRLVNRISLRSIIWYRTWFGSICGLNGVAYKKHYYQRVELLQVITILALIFDYTISGEGPEELVVQLFSRYCLSYICVSYLCISYFSIRSNYQFWFDSIRLLLGVVRYKYCNLISNMVYRIFYYHVIENLDQH